MKALFRFDASSLGSIDEASCWAVRAKRAERMASRYAEGLVSPAERTAAEQTMRLLRWDGETWVRRVVADAVKTTPFLPVDLALLYASDKEEVAVPLIEHSPVLRDGDLLQIVRDHPGAHRAAVARRKDISAQVAEAICRTGDSAALRALLANPRAEIAERNLRALLDDGVELPGVAAALARRLLDSAAARPSPSRPAVRELFRAIERNVAADVFSGGLHA